MNFFQSYNNLPVTEFNQLQRIREIMVLSTLFLAGLLAVISVVNNIDTLPVSKRVYTDLINYPQTILVPTPPTDVVLKIPFHRASTRYTPHPDLEYKLLNSSGVQAHIAHVITETYRISFSQALDIVDAVVEQSKLQKVDPLLLLGIIAQESSFRVRAVSSYGAKGLMQVVPRWHLNRMLQVGVTNILESSVSQQIKLGTFVLNYFMRRANNVETGLQYYNRGPNASPDPTLRYATRVLNNRNMFKREVLSYSTTVSKLQTRSGTL